MNLVYVGIQKINKINSNSSKFNTGLQFIYDIPAPYS
jgi:hypothetical protein